MYGKKNLVVRLATLTKAKETLQKRKDIKNPTVLLTAGVSFLV